MQTQRRHDIVSHVGAKGDMFWANCTCRGWASSMYTTREVAPSEKGLFVHVDSQTEGEDFAYKAGLAHVEQKLEEK